MGLQMIIDRTYLITEEEGEYLKKCKPYERNEFLLKHDHFDFGLVADKVKQEYIIKKIAGAVWAEFMGLYRDTETGQLYLRFYEWDTSN